MVNVIIRIGNSSVPELQHFPFMPFAWLNWWLYLVLTWKTKVKIWNVETPWKMDRMPHQVACHRPPCLKIDDKRFDCRLSISSWLSWLKSIFSASKNNCCSALCAMASGNVRYWGRGGGRVLGCHRFSLVRSLVSWLSVTLPLLRSFSDWQHSDWEKC